MCNSASTKSAGRLQFMQGTSARAQLLSAFSTLRQSSGPTTDPGSPHTDFSVTETLTRLTPSDAPSAALSGAFSLRAMRERRMQNLVVKGRKTSRVGLLVLTTLHLLGRASAVGIFNFAQQSFGLHSSLERHAATVPQASRRQLLSRWVRDEKQTDLRTMTHKDAVAQHQEQQWDTEQTHLLPQGLSLTALHSMGSEVSNDSSSVPGTVAITSTSTPGTHGVGSKVPWWAVLILVVGSVGIMIICTILYIFCCCLPYYCHKPASPRKPRSPTKHVSTRERSAVNVQAVPARKPHRHQSGVPEEMLDDSFAPFAPEHSEGHLTTSTAGPRGEHAAHRPAPTYSFSVSGHRRQGQGLQHDEDRLMVADDLSSTGRVRHHPSEARHPSNQDPYSDDINGPV